jgi:hypothetical protein
MSGQVFQAALRGGLFFVLSPSFFRIASLDSFLASLDSLLASLAAPMHNLA